MAGYGKNGNGNGVLEKRRRLISSMLIRRPNITRRELMDEIGKMILNPATGEPFSLGTIQNDIDALKEGWRERAAEDAAAWIAEQLATIDQLQGDAWSQRDYGVVLRCIQERAKLKGLYPAEKREISSLVKSLDLSALTDEQLNRLASGEDVLSVLTTQGGG